MCFIYICNIYIYIYIYIYLLIYRHIILDIEEHSWQIQSLLCFYSIQSRSHYSWKCNILCADWSCDSINLYSCICRHQTRLVVVFYLAPTLQELNLKFDHLYSNAGKKYALRSLTSQTALINQLTSINLSSPTFLSLLLLALIITHFHSNPLHTGIIIDVTFYSFTLAGHISFAFLGSMFLCV